MNKELKVRNELIGELLITPKLDKELATYLKRFCESRRVKRNADLISKLDDGKGLDFCYKNNPGVDGEFYANFDFYFENDESVINEDIPPMGQPSIYCPFTINEEGDKIIWSECLETKEPILWLRYLISNFLAPNGYIVNGKFNDYNFNGTDYTIEVEDNLVYAWYDMPLLRPSYILTTYGKTMTEKTFDSSVLAKQEYYSVKSDIINTIIKGGVAPKDIEEVQGEVDGDEFNRRVFIKAPKEEVIITLERVFK